MIKHQATKSKNGFAIVLEHLRRQLFDPAFIRDIDNVIVEPTDSSNENPVLLGAVDMCNNLPKWFPYKVQFVFPHWEYKVNNLWLIANNHRCIFVVTAHPHDLATLYASYSQAFRERKGKPAEAPAEAPVAAAATP